MGEGPTRDRDDVRAQLRAALAGRSDVTLAILFGSEARGTASAGSDVDLAVAGTQLKLLALGAELSTALGREVDVVSLAEATIPLLDRLIHEGVVVHEGERGAAARWRSATLLMLELDRPWYARMRDAWLAKVAREGLAGGER